MGAAVRRSLSPFYSSFACNGQAIGGQGRGVAGNIIIRKSEGRIDVDW